MNKLKHIYSFDVFDTCLVRTCGTPQNFFDILSNRVFNKPVPENIRQSFIYARRIEEEHRTKQSPFANIYDIYRDFSFPHPDLKGKEEILQLELALEKEVIVPVLETRKIITSLRNKGYRIMFISDMYLTYNFIKELLEKYDILEPQDKLFVSTNIGCSKFDGELFKHIHQSENIPYKNWTHYGDNKYCDYKVPKSLGIKSVQINIPYTLYEKEWIKKQNLATFKTNNIVAGISRSINCSQEDNPRKKLLIDVIAPLYCSFVSFIFNDARKRGISRLFFCARDTFQMFKTAQIINKKYPDISIYYLRISRKALQEENLENIIGYFCQEGLASNTTKTAIVDNTSSGTTLHYINEILHSNGYNDVFGYFLIKQWNGAWHTNPNLFYGIIYRDYLPINSHYEPLFKIYNLFVMEHIFSTNTQKMTIGYKYECNTYKPVFTEEIGDEESILPNAYQQQEYHTDILTQYAKNFINLELNNYACQILYQLAIPTLISFFRFPLKEYSESIMNCSLKLNGYTLPYIKKESLLQLLVSKGQDSWWKRGTAFNSLPQWALSLLKKTHQI